MSQYLLHYDAAVPREDDPVPVEPETAKQQQPLLDGVAGMLTFVLGLCSVLMIGGGIAILLFDLVTPPSISSATASAMQWITDGLCGVAFSFVLYCFLGRLRLHSSAPRANFRVR